MRRHRGLTGRLLLLSVLALVGSACAVSGRGPVDASHAEIHTEAHPLIGVIWSSAREARIDRDGLERELAAARYVLLGEHHDNPEHHHLQASLVAALAAGPHPPAIVFEMLESGQEPAIEAFLAERTTSEARRDVLEFAERVEWAESGWPEFAIYRPLFEVVLAAGLPIFGAGLPRGDSLAPDAPERAPRFGLHEPLPPEERAARIEEMFVAHCEQVPEEILAPMVEKQRARDARMANVLLRAAEQAGRAILVAGNGHVRHAGVEAVLVRAGVERSGIASVGLLEVGSEEREIADTGADRFDFTILTPTIEREDPCKAF